VSGDEPKFIADVMVGKLARWLRVLGIDVSYSNAYEDDEIVRIANTEGRIVLTRDTGLAARRSPVRFVLIQSDDYTEQIDQVVREVGITEFKLFTRCLECNVVLISVDKETVFDRVPPFVYLTQERFALCPSCNRVFWHGTHADQMLKRIRS
jgi:uncharacterized protein with PIN domain